MKNFLTRAFSTHRRDRLCFVHIPSCGGTTLWQVLSDVYGPRNIRRKRGSTKIHDYFEPGAANERFLAKRAVIGGHMRLGRVQQQFPDRPRFTFVRDPAARMKSAYARQVRMGKWTPDEALGAEDLVRYAESAHRSTLLRKYLTEPYLEPGAGAEAIAEQLRRNFDLICVTEDFDRSLLLMQAKYGWPEPPTYDRRNIGGEQRRKIPQDVMDAVREIVADEYEVLEAAKQVYREHLAAHAGAVTDAKLEAFQAANSAREKDLLAQHDGHSPFDRERRAQAGKAE